MQAVKRISEVLETIVCPVCHGHLALHAVGTSVAIRGTAPTQSSIRCLACRRSYPIEDGIPVLLTERAILERESSRMEKPGDHAVSDGERNQESDGYEREHERP
jgi:uncharacterized protein YbaR (Trm112 family)